MNKTCQNFCAVFLALCLLAEGPIPAFSRTTPQHTTTLRPSIENRTERDVASGLEEDERKPSDIAAIKAHLEEIKLVLTKNHPLWEELGPQRTQVEAFLKTDISKSPDDKSVESYTLLFAKTAELASRISNGAKNGAKNAEIGRPGNHVLGQFMTKEESRSLRNFMGRYHFWNKEKATGHLSLRHTLEILETLTGKRVRYESGRFGAAELPWFSRLMVRLALRGTNDPIAHPDLSEQELARFADQYADQHVDRKTREISPENRVEIFNWTKSAAAKKIELPWVTEMARFYYQVLFNPQLSAPQWKNKTIIPEETVQRAFDDIQTAIRNLPKSGRTKDDEKPIRALRPLKGNQQRAGDTAKAERPKARIELANEWQGASEQFLQALKTTGGTGKPIGDGTRIRVSQSQKLFRAGTLANLEQWLNVSGHWHGLVVQEEDRKGKTIHLKMINVNPSTSKSASRENLEQWAADLVRLAADKTFLIELWKPLETGLEEQVDARILHINENASFGEVVESVPQGVTVVYRLYREFGDKIPKLAFISPMQSFPTPDDGPAPINEALVHFFGNSARDMDYSVKISNRPDQTKTTWIDIAPRQLVVPGNLPLGEILRVLVNSLEGKSLPVARASVPLYIAEIIHNTNKDAYKYKSQLNTRVTLTWNARELRAVLEDQSPEFYSVRADLEQSMADTQPSDDPAALVRELFGQLDVDQAKAVAAGGKPGGKLGTPMLRRAYREGLFSLVEETYTPGEGTRRVLVFKNPDVPTPPPAKKLSPAAVEIQAAYADKPYAVGVDITRQGVSVALSGPNNKVERRTAPPVQNWLTTGGTLDSSKNPEQIVDAIVDQIVQMINESGLSGDRMNQVVVSIVAAVNDEAADRETGNPQPAPYLLAFNNYSLRAILQEKLLSRLGGKASPVVLVYNRARASLSGESSSIGTLRDTENAAFFYFGPGISGDLAKDGNPVPQNLGYREIGRVTVGKETGGVWHYEFRGRELAGFRFEPTATELQVEQRLSEPALEQRAKDLGYENLDDLIQRAPSPFLEEVSREIGRFMAAALAPYVTGDSPEVVPQRTVLAGSVVHRLAVALGPAAAIGLIRDALSSELISHFHADSLITESIVKGIVFSRIGTDEERQFAAALTLLQKSTAGLEETPDDLAARLVAALAAENREGEIQLTQREAARLLGGSPSQSFLSSNKGLLTAINEALPKKLTETRLTKVTLGTGRPQKSASDSEEDGESEAVAVDVTSIIPVLMETIAAGLRGTGPRQKNGRREIQFTVEDGVASVSSQTLNKILPKDLAGSVKKTRKLHDAFATLEVRLEITDLFRAILSKEKPSDGRGGIFWETDNAKLLRSQRIWRVQIVPPRDAVEFFAESATNGDSTMLAVQEIQRRANRGAPFTMNEVWTVLLLFHNLVLREAADQTFNRFLDGLKKRFPENDPDGDFRSARLVWQIAYPVLQESLDLANADELERLFSDAADQIEQELPKNTDRIIDFSPTRTVLPADKTSSGLEETPESRLRRSADIFKQRGWIINADSFTTAFLKTGEFLRQDLVAFEQKTSEVGGVDRMRLKWRKAIENKQRFLPAFNALMEHLSEPASKNHDLKVVSWKSSEKGYGATLEYQFENQPLQAFLTFSKNPEFPILRISLNRKVSGNNPLLPIAEVRLGKDRKSADLHPKPSLHLDILIKPERRSWLEHEDLMPVWSTDSTEDLVRVLERFQNFLASLESYLAELPAAGPSAEFRTGLEESGRHANWTRNHQAIIAALQNHPGGDFTATWLGNTVGLSKTSLGDHKWRAVLAEENSGRGEPPLKPFIIPVAGGRKPTSPTAPKPPEPESPYQTVMRLDLPAYQRLAAAASLVGQSESPFPTVAVLSELFSAYLQENVRLGLPEFSAFLKTAEQIASLDGAAAPVVFWNTIYPVIREAEQLGARDAKQAIPELFKRKQRELLRGIPGAAGKLETQDAAEILRWAFIRDGQIDPRISPFLNQSPTDDLQEKDIRWVKAFLALMTAPPAKKTTLPPLSVSDYNAGPFSRSEISEETLRDYVENEWIATLEKILRATAEQITRRQSAIPVTAEDLGLKQIRSLMRALTYAEDDAGQRLFPNLSESEIYRWSYRDLPRLLVPLISPTLSRTYIPPQLLDEALANPLNFSNESGNRAAADAIRNLLENQPETFTDNPVKLRRNPGKNLLPWLRLAIALNLIDYSQPALAREIEQAGGVMQYVLPRMGTPFSEALGGERFINSFIADILKPNQALVHIPDNNAEIAGSLKLAELLLSVNPTLNISMIVKVDNGVMNDASMEDARRLLERQSIYEKLRQYQANGRFRLIPGAKSHGTPLNRLTPEAVNAIQAADLVLSQGEANTWNLNGLAKPIYLGLRLKWLTGVEKIFGVNPDPERPPAFIKIDGTGGAYFQNPFGTLPNVPRVTIRQTVLAQNPEMTAGVVLGDPKPLRDPAYGETQTVSIERANHTLTGRTVLIHPAKTLIRQRLNPQVISGSWEWKGLRRLDKNDQPGDPLMEIIDKPSAWNNLSLPMGAEPIFASNSLQTNFWEPNGFLIIDGQLVAIPGVRQAEPPWVFVLEAAAAGKIGLRRLTLTDGIPQTNGILQAVVGPVLVRAGKSVASRIRRYPTEGGAANADADLSKGAYANRTRWDPKTTHAAFSALGRTNDNQLVFLSLVGRPETGQKQASVEDVAEALIQSGAVEAVLLGGSMDVQQWAVGDGEKPGILGRHNSTPHDSQRNLNTAIVIYTNPAAGQEELVSVADAQDKALARLSSLYAPLSAAPESTVLVFENPESFGLVPVALRWGWRVAILSDGDPADALRSLLEQMRIPRDRYAIGYLETSYLLDNPALRLISIENREQGLRQLGLNPDDLPKPMAETLDAIHDFIESMV